MSDTKFINICSVTIHIKKISACSNVFLECMICFDEFEEASFQLAPLTLETFSNTQKLKRACIESF